MSAPRSNPRVYPLARGMGVTGATDGRTDELTHVLVAERVEPTAPDAHEKSHLIEIATSTTEEKS